jgi:hemerythrin-like domain-containing protein
MPSRMDSIVSKGAAAVKSVEARLQGLVGVFRTLCEQHAEAGALLKRIKNDPSKRVFLWPKVRRELISHEKGELREVYPVLSEHAETRALARQHDVEASELTILIDRIDATRISSEEWGALFDQLVSLVERHVREEEQEIFPQAQDILGADRAREIEPRFLAAKKQVAAGLPVE